MADATSHTNGHLGDSFKEAMVSFFNEGRVEAGLGEIASTFDMSMANVTRQSIVASGFKVNESLDEFATKLRMLMETNLKLQNYALCKDFTHVDGAFLPNSDQESIDMDIEISFYSRFLEIEAPGQLIDGDLVVQGSTLTPEWGPALCVVDFIVEGSDEVKERAAVIRPWDMITMPMEGDSTLLNFHIPVQLPAELKELTGSVKVKIYINEVSKIPYSEDTGDYDDSGSNYVSALEFTAKSANVAAAVDSSASAVGDEDGNIHVSGGGGVEGGEVSGENPELPTHDEHADGSSGGSPDAHSNPHHHHHHHHHHRPRRSHFVKDIRIALDYDELAQLRSEGFDSNCVHFLPEGALQDENEQRWTFHIMNNYEQFDDNDYGLGVEDVVWFRCEKSIGTIPAVPGYEVYHDNDLTSPENDFSVYLCAKRTESPAFKSMKLVTCDLDNEQQFRSYIENNKLVFKQAPMEICNQINGIAGLLLEVIEPATNGMEVDTDLGMDASLKQESPSSNSRKRTSSREGGGSREGSRSNTPKHTLGLGGDVLSVSDDGEDSDDDYFDNLEDSIAQQENQLSALLAERDACTHVHLELQQRAAILIAREKIMQGQNTTAKSAQEAALQAIYDANNFPEVQAEKEKQFREGLQIIIEDRKKLARQSSEFDHLANDLQTRLDDKEYKATEITESFRKFKREILSKAVNSRTGLPILKTDVQTLENNEQKRDEDLEKVRLRNISLRTTLKKIEKALRAREQLAEGLHMIDFEQLKIENQTLNEKIEERNEELAKLKRKKQITVQMLTHVREKIRFYDKCNSKLKGDVSGVETNINGLRGTLSVHKHDRDVVKRDIKELKRQQGFATSDLLIVDYENRKSELEVVRSAVRELQQKYKVLTAVVESQPRAPLISIYNNNFNNASGGGNIMPPKPKL